MLLVDMAREEWGEAAEKTIYGRLMIGVVDNLGNRNTELLGKEFVQMRR